MIEEHGILDQVPAGIVVIDREERIRYVNDWIVAVTGFSRDELLHAPVSKIMHGFPQDPAETHTQIARQAFLICATNTTLPVYSTVRTVPLPDAFGTCFGIMLAPDSGLDRIRGEIESVGRDHYYGLFGKSPCMQEMYGFIEMAADTDANVVIQGESGTGKELVAAAIHAASHRRNRPFIRVNCGALTETLLESELFGHTKGAFTGAYRDHEGKFQAADTGTILLDEIGEISPGMQVKLLRVLQDRVVVRVGDNREIPVDVRVIAATNRNLRSLVTKGRFREDLFYRLNVFPIHVPALREHSTDVPLPIDHFMETFRRKTGRQIASCSPDVLRILMEYCWPGNVRELENAIEHAFVLSRGKELQMVDLPHELRIAAVREGICAEKSAGIIEHAIHTSTVRRLSGGHRLSITRERLEQELARHDGNKTATARTLGISKVGLWKKMKKLGLYPSAP